MKYTPVIGLEVHVELNTQTKMFCRCSADYFGKEPNTQTCPICLGLPGALPYANKEALDKCIQIGLALGCEVSQKSLFERKNYFYPDLPKGYQISQYRWPLCTAGSLQLTAEQQIRINRVHQEEDTAKLVNQPGISNSKFSISNEEKQMGIDFNRSGVPLVEIVTEPDFTSSSDVYEFAKKLQQILKALNVSNGDMEKGDLRLEANVSIRSEGATELPPYRVELKNINSFRFMKHAIDYEVERQTKAIENGEKLVQETRGWSEEKKESYPQRSKEEARDYRYFPDPDLPQLAYSDEEIEKIRNEITELPEQLIERIVRKYDLALNTATILVSQNALEYFEEVVGLIGKDTSATQIANLIVNKKVDIKQIKPEDFVKSFEVAGKSIMEDKEIEQIALQVIEENPKAVEDYKKGKENSLQFLLGKVISKTKGQADANHVKNILENLVKN